MDIETLRDYILSLPEAEETQPFGEDTVVFKVRGKMFAMFIFEPGRADWIWLKCNKDYAILLRDRYMSAVEPGWHMNRTYWNMVNFTSWDITDEDLRHFIAHSYNEVLQKMSRPKRAGLHFLQNGIYDPAK